jgi:hypothetical protein
VIGGQLQASHFRIVFKEGCLRVVRLSPLPSGEPISIGKQIDYGRCDVREMASLERTLIRSWKSRTSKEVL